MLPDRTIDEGRVSHPQTRGCGCADCRGCKAAPPPVLHISPALKAWRDEYRKDRIVIANAAGVVLYDFEGDRRMSAHYDTAAEAIAALQAGAVAWVSRTAAARRGRNTAHAEE